jgi:hypothetical protein
MPAQTVSNPQRSPPCSLITVRASSSSRSAANFACLSDLRFVLHPLIASVNELRDERLLRVDQAQTIARLSPNRMFWLNNLRNLLSTPYPPEAMVTTALHFPSLPFSQTVA